MRAWFGLLSIVVAPVLNTGCTPGGSDGPRGSFWTLEEFFRLGSVDDAEVSFTAVSDILVEGAWIYVLESQPPRVLQFDRSGNRIRAFGRQGQGPGEFTRPSQLGFAQGKLWVSDPSGARLELFSQDGEFLESVRFQIQPDSAGVRNLPKAILPDGHILAGPGPLSIGGVVSGSIDHLTYLQTDSVGTILKEILRLPIARSDFFQASLGQGGIMGGHPLPEGPVVDVFPDGRGMVVLERWVSEEPDSDAIRILAYDGNGLEVFDKEISYRPIPVPDGWIGRFLERQMVRAGRAPPESQRRELLEAVRGGLSDRDFFPPVTRVVAGNDGSIWMRREEVSFDSVRWDVVTSAGAWEGRLWAAANLQIHAASRDTVWGVIPDELDVPYVVGLKVVR